MVKLVFYKLNDKIISDSNNFLKSRIVQYTRREGSPGHFKYFYDESKKQVKKNMQKLDDWVKNESSKFREWAEKYSKEHSLNKEEKNKIVKYLIHSFQSELMRKFGVA